MSGFEQAGIGPLLLGVSVQDLVTAPMTLHCPIFDDAIVRDDLGNDKRESELPSS
jgi:hypothetical protein